jgi:hypothetical protein
LLSTELPGIVVGFLGIMVVFWPGLLTPDSAWMLEQARSGAINDWLGPIPIWLIRTLHVSGAEIFAATTLAFLVVTARLFRRRFSPLIAGAIAAAISWSPPVLGWLSALGRDTWFGIAALVGVLAVTSELPPGRIERLGRWTALGVASIAALCSRQNAAPVVSGLLAVELFGLWSAYPRWRRLAWSAAGGVLTTVVMLGGISLVTSRIVHPVSTSPEQVTYVSDLAAISLKTGDALVPPNVWYGTPDYERLAAVWDDDDGSAIYNVENPPIHTVSSGIGALRRRWLAAIVDHPVRYVQRRATLVELQLFESTERCDPFVPGMSGIFPGHTLAHPHRADLVIGWEGTFWRMSGLRVWHLLLASLIAAWWLRRTDVARLAWTLQLVSWLAVASLVPTAAVCAYRFTWLSVAASLITIGLAVGSRHQLSFVLGSASRATEVTDDGE